jgi:hypothetical protein
VHEIPRAKTRHYDRRRLLRSSKGKFTFLGCRDQQTEQKNLNIQNMHINTRQIPKSSYKYFIEHELDLITLSLQRREARERGRGETQHQRQARVARSNLNITNGRSEREKSFA